jgi:hypothetical protein
VGRIFGGALLGRVADFRVCAVCFSLVRWEQVFSSVEYDFLTARGLVTSLIPIIAALLMAPLYSGIVASYTNVGFLSFSWLRPCVFFVC